MTEEQLLAFNVWWNKSSIGCDRGTDCRSAFEAGWQACLLRSDPPTVFINQHEANRALRDKIMDKAVASFREGNDETARLYRELATELFGKV